MRPHIYAATLPDPWGPGPVSFPLSVSFFCSLLLPSDHHQTSPLGLRGLGILNPAWSVVANTIGAEIALGSSHSPSSPSSRTGETVCRLAFEVLDAPVPLWRRLELDPPVVLCDPTEPRSSPSSSRFFLAAVRVPPRIVQSPPVSRSSCSISSRSFRDVLKKEAAYSSALEALVCKESLRSPPDVVAELLLPW